MSTVFQLEVPPTPHASGAFADEWQVVVSGGGPIVYSNPYKGFSPGMLVNELILLPGSVATAHPPAVFRSVTKGEHFRVMSEAAGTGGAGVRDKLVPLAYRGDITRIVVLEIQPRAYPTDFELWTHYGHEFNRSSYPARHRPTPDAHSAPPIVAPTYSQATEPTSSQPPS